MHFFSRLHHNIQAICFVLIGYSFFAVADAMAKYLRTDDSVNTILAISSFIALALSAIAIYLRHGFGGFYTPKWKYHALRGALLAASAHLVVYAFETVPLAEFYGIAFFSPFLVTILSVLFLKEPIKNHQMAAIIGGFAGVIVLTGPQYDQFSTGILCVIGSTTLFSANLLILRKIGPEPSPLIFPLFPFIGIFLSSAPFADIGWTERTGSSFLFYGIYGLVLFTAQLALARGFAMASSTATVAPFHYCQIVWGILFGYVIFGDFPGLTTWAGLALIVASGLYMILHERRLHRKTADPATDPLPPAL